MSEVGPPFTLSVTDLSTGGTRILLENEVDQYFQPIWSEDGNRLAYTVRQDGVGGYLGLFVIDLTTGEAIMVVPGSENSRLRPCVWLSDDRLVYTEGDITTGNSRNPDATLYTISIQVTEMYKSLRDL